MRERSIVYFINQTQQEDGSEVYCPMCEVWHMDESWCQFPGWEG